MQSQLIYNLIPLTIHWIVCACAADPTLESFQKRAYPGGRPKPLLLHDAMLSLEPNFLLGFFFILLQFHLDILHILLHFLYHFSRGYRWIGRRIQGNNELNCRSTNSPPSHHRFHNSTTCWKVAWSSSSTNARLFGFCKLISFCRILPLFQYFILHFLDNFLTNSGWPCF